jgi:CheY-like chemotaxis protein
MIILYVDDDIDDTEFFCEVLEEIYPLADCITSRNGVEALKVVSETCPDYIFLNYRMPAIDGLEVLKTIKDSNFCQGSKIIMYSDFTFSFYRKECEEMGAFDCWQKMVSKEDLYRRLEKLFTPTKLI